MWLAIERLNKPELNGIFSKQISQEALTSIPEPDEPEDAAVKGREGELDSSIKKGGGKTKVHYISLKPLTKKERKRQQRMAAEIAAAEAELKEEEQVH